jgi:hypothetical protein
MYTEYEREAAKASCSVILPPSTRISSSYVHATIRTLPHPLLPRTPRLPLAPPRPQIALLRGRVLALSTSLVAVTYVLPCTKSSASVLACDPSAADQCIPCPNVRAYAGYACCVAARRDGSTMDGDFFKLPEPTFPEAETEGGHAMTLVGYSDAYRTEFGYVGGFILKNSWWDGLPPSADWKQVRI